MHISPLGALTLCFPEVNRIKHTHIEKKNISVTQDRMIANIVHIAGSTNRLLDLLSVECFRWSIGAIHCYITARFTLSYMPSHIHSNPFT